MAGGGNIVRTPRGKHYLILSIDAFTDYIWIYLAGRNSEFLGILKEFLVMLKAQGLSVKSS